MHQERSTIPSHGLVRLPFHYGWVVLVMAALAMTATLPGRTHGLGLIAKPMTEDLGVTPVLFSTLNFWAILLGSLVCLPIGKLIDRFGVRLLLTGVSLALALSVLGMSQASGVAVLFATLTLVRGFGQGALSIVSMAMVGKWFTRRLGMAMAVYTVLLSIGFIASTLGVGEAVKRMGWREVWQGVGLFLALVLAPLAWLLVRDTPESAGLPPDSANEAPPDRAALDLSLGDALRSRAFWSFTLAASLFNLVWSAITLFQESLLDERGFDHDTFVQVMTMLVAAGLPANLLAGWLIPRWGLGRILLAGMTILALSLVCFPHLQTGTDAILYGLALGLSGGIITVVFFTVYGRAFGRTHLGAIQSMVQAVSVVASALGPLLLTLCKEWTGSHAPFFYFCAVLAVALGVMAWASPLPKPALQIASKKAGE